MISRFTKIKGVGKFIDCGNLGGKHFGKNTIIFGQNTAGKTTLTDILWSFKTGDSSFIEGRKSFGFNAIQSVEICNENNVVAKFPSQNWAKGYDKIEIFDNQFVNNNIFEGTEINFGQQQRLNSIIIGKNGNEIANKILEIQNEVERITALKRTRSQEFSRAFENKITYEDFNKLPVFNDAPDLIIEKKRIIATSRNQVKIKELFNNSIVKLENIISQQTKIILSKSIETNAEKATKHILENWQDPNSSKDFLQTGLLLTKEQKENCSFCGQVLSKEAIDLLNTYAVIFSNEFKNLQNEIIEAVDKFEKFNALKTIVDLILNFKLLDITLDKNESDLNRIQELQVNSCFEFAKKKLDLSYLVNFKDFDEIIIFFKNLLSQVIASQPLYVYPNEIGINFFEKQIFNIETSQKRYSLEWESFVKVGNNLNLDQEAAKSKREVLRVQLEEYSELIYKEHFKTINHLLFELEADFQICSPAPLKKLVGQKERVFALEFYKNYKIEIGDKTGHRPIFKNTLSESDKRLLAFTFFYSNLLHDPEIEKKIVVFDDPFSSFDINRRNKTIQLLANPYIISPEGERINKSFEQLIILTHEKEFYKWIYTHLNKPKALKIVSNGHCDNVKKSTIEDCDVEIEFIQSVNKTNLKQLKKIITENKPILDFGSLSLKCRKIMENVFTKKYLFDLEEEINKNKSIRTFTKRLHELEINNFGNYQKYNDYIILCDNLNIEMHDNEFTNGDGNEITILKDFFRLLHEI